MFVCVCVCACVLVCACTHMCPEAHIIPHVHCGVPALAVICVFPCSERKALTVLIKTTQTHTHCTAGAKIVICSGVAAFLLNTRMLAKTNIKTS